MSFFFGFILGAIVTSAIVLGLFYLLFLDKPNENGRSKLEERVQHQEELNKEDEGEIKRRVTVYSDAKVKKGNVVELTHTTTPPPGEHSSHSLTSACLIICADGRVFRALQCYQ
jgi:hypothetical protein